MRLNRMLASVSDPDEARIAMELGADIIDCKDPARGALGALDPALIRQVVRAIDRRLVSATLGDLPTDAWLLGEAIRATAKTGVNLIKIGLFDNDRLAHTLDALSPTARRHRLVVVLFADRAPAMDIVPELAAAKFTGVMIDTADKGTGSLLDHIDADQLAGFVVQARHHRLLCGLAGLLRLEQVSWLLPIGADFLGFRSALCAGMRTAAIDATRFRLVRRALRAAATDQRSAA